MRTSERKTAEWRCGICGHWSPARFRARCAKCGAVKGLGYPDRTGVEERATRVDLVARLRHHADRGKGPSALLREAADEINRLTRELEAAREREQAHERSVGVFRRACEEALIVARRELAAARERERAIVATARRVVETAFSLSGGFQRVHRAVIGDLHRALAALRSEAPGEEQAEDIARRIARDCRALHDRTPEDDATMRDALLDMAGGIEERLASIPGAARLRGEGGGE